MVNFVNDAGIARDSIINDVSKGVQKVVQDIHYRHGPKGILARTMPTGRIVFWAMAMLGGYLFIEFLAVYF